MPSNSEVLPVVLFAYARPDHLRRCLDCLKANRVPLVYAFSDGPRDENNVAAVAQARDILRAVDWCDVKICEQETNLGLGRSILAGVTEILDKHDAAIIVEDDLVCVPGAYDYLCAALRRYRDDPRVMSVTGWTHPRITPDDVANRPYFDGRAECLVWGAWARSWRGMDRDAETLMRKCAAQGIDVFRYGADLPGMAKRERQKNTWAVRFLYWHILNQGLCLRPPWSMVEHIGFDAEATNAKTELWIKNPPLKPAPPIPSQWPEPAEHSACCTLWQQVLGTRPTVPGRLYRSCRRVAARALRTVSMK